MRCENCKFWAAYSFLAKKGVPAGDCRFSPPVFLTVAENKDIYSGFWPETSKDDWCGKFTAKD
jgi:hypothetical protein